MYTVKIQMYSCQTFATEDGIAMSNLLCKMKNVSFLSDNIVVA